jgi:hypothetical protein
MSLSRFQFGFALAVLAATTAVATSGSPSSPPPLFTPGTPPPPFPVESIWPGQTFEDAKAQIETLRRERNERHIRIEYAREKCVDESSDEIAGRHTWGSGHCFSAIKLTGEDYDLTVNFVEDYPNHPGQMCVASIEYDQLAFHNNGLGFDGGLAFVKVTDQQLGTPLPEFRDDSQLDSEISRRYLYGMTRCYRANNCFTAANKCMMAEQCLEVSAARDNVQGSGPTIYVKVVAFPYEVQQNAYVDAATEDALDGKIHVYPAFSAPSPASDQPVCSTAALLVPPLVSGHLDKLQTSPDASSREVPLKYIEGAMLTACDPKLCMMEYKRSDHYEIVTFFKASGQWEEIWRVQGPFELNDLAEIRALLKHQRANDGWNEEWIGNSYPLPTP